MSSIRPLKDEVKEVAQILGAPSEGLSWSSPWSEDQIREEIREAISLGYFESNHLIAFLFARESDGVLEITNLGTDLQFRRQGTMRRLLKELMNMKSNSAIWLEVHEANQPAIRLYESLNFLEVGRRRNYYKDGAAAVLMKRAAT